MVAAVHAPHLRQGDVRLVHKQQKILWEIVQQRVGTAAGRAAGEHAGVVLDALAETDFGQHLHVVVGALHDALRLDQLIVCFKVGHPLLHLVADLDKRLLHLLPRHNVVGRRVDGFVGDNVLDLPCDDVDLGDSVDLVAEKLNPHGGVARIGGKNLHHVAAHPELVAGEVDVVALILQLHQLFGQLVPLLAHAGAQRDDHVAVIDWVTQGVDAGDTGHNDDVPALGQGGSGRVTKFFDLVVDGAVLFDIGVGVCDVGFRLVVVVVADKILHRIVWKKRLKLRTKLGGQRLVVRQHQRRTVDLLDDVCHGEGFARTGDAEQRLLLIPAEHPLRQGVDRLRLVAGWLIVRDELKRPVFFLHPVAPFMNLCLVSFDFSTAQTGSQTFSENCPFFPVSTQKAKENAPHFRGVRIN